MVVVRAWTLAALSALVFVFLAATQHDAWYLAGVAWCAGIGYLNWHLLRRNTAMRRACRRDDPER
jgi:hypothetical protein